MNNKRILIISSEAFSQSSSNGRTLMNFLKNIPKEYLGQFYLHGTADQDFCSVYYKNSDNDALRTFLLRKKKKNSEQLILAEQMYTKQKPMKSYRNLVLRNIVWQSMKWWKEGFEGFLNSFKPEVVLLQAGDSPFMYAIALKVAKKYKANLMMFNTESYVLKKVMYASVKKDRFWHFLLMSSLQKQYLKFMDKADYCIYSLEALEDAYQQKYPHPQKSCTLYTTSEIKNLPDLSCEPFNLLYCGNLGVGRDVPLNDIAKALYEVDKTAKIDIYGKFVSKESQNMLCSNPNVKYHGFIDYSQIPSIMSKASMLIHCENNDRIENLRYAFSTKIADSISSARPFLAYASFEYPFIQYLSKNRCAHIASNSDELKSVLKKCIGDKNYLYKYTANAKISATKNHNREVNCTKIGEILDVIDQRDMNELEKNKTK